MTSKSKAEVIPLFRRSVALEHEPEIPLNSAPVAAAATGAAPQGPVSPDLTGQAKAWFLIGPNGSGKTLLARWMGWTMTAAGRSAMMAALDPQNRSLATWFAGVVQPETNDGAQTARWLRAVLQYLMDGKASAILDFGGGDTALAKLVHETPDLAGLLTTAGVNPVACYTVGPRVEDLASLDAMEAAGFQPAATLIALNEGRVDSTLMREEAFARVLRHGAFVRAVERGAVPLWLPRLEPEVAAEIEGKRLTFGQARDGQVPEDAKFAPIGGFHRAMVGRWLKRMDQELAPVASWFL